MWVLGLHTFQSEDFNAKNVYLVMATTLIPAPANLALPVIVEYVVILFRSFV